MVSNIEPIADLVPSICFLFVTLAGGLVTDFRSACASTNVISSLREPFILRLSGGGGGGRSPEERKKARGGRVSVPKRRSSGMFAARWTPRKIGQSRE